MADIPLALSLSAQSRAGGSRDQNSEFCKGLPIAPVPGLYGNSSPQTVSTDMSPPGTGRTSGDSTPSPPWIAGSYAHSNSLSSGEDTPPEQPLLQQLHDSLELDKSCQLPLKPGLLDVAPAFWPLPLLPGPPGLSSPLPPPLGQFMAVPAVVPVTTPAPAPLPVPPPSLGSVGHPDTCAEACKYVKRKTGCRMGADCPQCHQCFWRHRRVDNAESASICAPYSAGGQCCAPEVDKTPVVQESLGSVNHPHGCAAPCKYIKRKGGCRLGASCPDCHLCHWRRNPPEAAAKPAGLDDETGLGFSTNATQRLQNLIRLQLDTTAGKSTPGAPNLEPMYLEPVSSTSAPPSATVEQPDAHREGLQPFSCLI